MVYLTTYMMHCCYCLWWDSKQSDWLAFVKVQHLFSNSHLPCKFLCGVINSTMDIVGQWSVLTCDIIFYTRWVERSQFWILGPEAQPFHQDAQYWWFVGQSFTDFPDWIYRDRDSPKPPARELLEVWQKTHGEAEKSLSSMPSGVWLTWFEWSLLSVQCDPRVGGAKLNRCVKNRFILNLVKVMISICGAEP